MNINFVDTIEFEVFCDLGNIDLETIKNLKYILQNNLTWILGIIAFVSCTFGKHN